MELANLIHFLITQGIWDVTKPEIDTSKKVDIRILGNDGKELWKKTNEIPRGGRILENANLNDYTGNITIGIDNIVSDPSVNEIIMKQLKEVSN